MSAWTPEREAFLREYYAGTTGDGAELLAALTAERARREAAERQVEARKAQTSAAERDFAEARRACHVVLERAERAEAERDEARAALAALREAAEHVPSMLRNNGFPDTAARLGAALSAAAPIAGRYRADLEAAEIRGARWALDAAERAVHVEVPELDPAEVCRARRGR